MHISEAYDYIRAQNFAGLSLQKVKWNKIFQFSFLNFFQPSVILLSLML